MMHKAWPLSAELAGAAVLGASMALESASALEVASAPWRQLMVTVGRAAIRLGASRILSAPYASAGKVVFVSLLPCRMAGKAFAQ